MKTTKSFRESWVSRFEVHR